jgi:hypothetical protein
MKSFLVAVFLAATFPQPHSYAQARLDFSGTWKMDHARSDSPAIGPVTVVITQSSGDLKIETTKEGESNAVTYKLDGSEVKTPSWTSKARWDGAALVTVVAGSIQKEPVSVQETRTLSADGNEMFVDVVLIVQHGYSPIASNYGTGKDVYVRSR